MDVTNPGSVNVADQGDGPLSVNQPVTVGASQNSGLSVDGDDYSPTSSNVITTAQNSVVGQVYGTGAPAQVYV